MAITRGVLSRTIGSKTIVNIQEVTNDESPPVVTNGNTQSINVFEGEVFDTTGMTTLEASDRLGFSWSKASGPSEISINSTTGQINSSKAVSRFASWNNDGEDINPVLRATDTAGNFADVDLTINPTYGSSFSSWAAASTIVSETHDISYNITSSISQNTQIPVALSTPFTESEYASYFDQLNLTSDQGTSSGGVSGYGSVFCVPSSIGDEGARQNLRISHSGTAGSKTQKLLSHNQNVGQSDLQSDWVAGGSLEAVFSAVPDNFYYYEVITNPSTTGYNGQFVDANGQNPEAFRGAPDDCLRVLHSSKADECVISTGQIVNIGATYGMTGQSTLLQFPPDLIKARNATSFYQSLGNTYYAINNGDGTISFATSLANATATPPVKVAWSNNDWGGTSDSNAARTSIRIRPSAIRKHVYNISNPMVVTYTCPGAPLFGTQNWANYSANADAFYYKPDRDAGTITIANFTLTGGVAGTVNVNTPFYTATGLTLSETGQDTFRISASAGSTSVPTGIFVVTAEDVGLGRLTKTMNITAVDEIVVTGIGGQSGTVFADASAASWGGGNVGQINTSGGNGTKTFIMVSRSSGLTASNLAVSGSGMLSLDSGYVSPTSVGENFVVRITDSKGFTEDITLTLKIGQFVSQTITHGTASPTGGVDYYGYYNANFSPAGSISPARAPGFFPSAANETQSAMYQSAFGSYSFYFTVFNQGTSLPQNSFTSITIDDGVNTRTFNSSNATYSGSLGSPTFTQWRWFVSSSDAQYQRISGLNPNGSATWTITLN